MSIKITKKQMVGILIIGALAIGIMAALVVRNNAASQEAVTTTSIGEESSKEPIKWVESMPDTSSDYFISETDEIESRGFEPAIVQ